MTQLWMKKKGKSLFSTSKRRLTEFDIRSVFSFWEIILSSLVIVFFSAGCLKASVPDSERISAIFVSGANCSAPCWHSLRPGLSTETDFLNTVDVSGSRRFDDVDRTELHPEGMEYTWFDREYDFFSRIVFHDGRMTLLGFRPLNNSISLSGIREMYGRPGAYGASILGSHDDYYVKTNLIYEQEGVVIEADYSVDSDELQTVRANCEFEFEWDALPNRLTVYLVSPEDAGEMVLNDPIGGFSHPSHYPQPWPDERPLPLTRCP